MSANEDEERMQIAAALGISRSFLINLSYVKCSLRFLQGCFICAYVCPFVCVLQAVMAAPAVGIPGSRVTDCVTKVALSISCEDLLDMDTFSKSDPLCVLLMNSSGPHWCEVRRLISCSSTYAC